MANSKQYQNWEEVFQNPQEILIGSLNTGYIRGTEEGMFNVNAGYYRIMSDDG